LVFGLFFIFELAPLNGTDEFTHFPRVYQITDGTFWEGKLPNNQYGGSLPVNINTMIDTYRNLSRESGGPQYQQDKHTINEQYLSTNQVGVAKVPATFTSVVLYPPWAYLPSVVGVLFAKLIHAPLIWYVYLGRIFSLLAWMILTWLAIKVIPQGKWFLVALALLPTSLSQAITMSADGLINSISWLLIALVLAVFAKTVVLTKKNLLLITLLATYLCIIKEGYWLIAFFPLIIHPSYFKNVRQSRVWKSLSLSIMLVASILFALNAKRTLSNVVLSPIAGAYINTKLQTHYLLHHLLLFTFRALEQPLTKSFDTIYLGMFGIMTNRLIYLSILIIGLLAFALYLGLHQTKSIVSLMEHRNRLWITAIIILLGTYLLIAVSFYLGETSVGGSTINSIYGRYFLPLLPLILIFPMTLKRDNIFNATRVIALMLTISTISLIMAAMSIGQ
jgi:uncharacterized membrane protein